MTSRGGGRRRARPTFREVHVTVRSVRLTRRWLEMATLKTVRVGSPGTKVRRLSATDGLTDQT